jgi:hypothetical protein
MVAEIAPKIAKIALKTRFCGRFKHINNLPGRSIFYVFDYLSITPVDLKKFFSKFDLIFFRGWFEESRQGQDI